ETSVTAARLEDGIGKAQRVEVLGHHQDVQRAGRNAQLAALAAVGLDDQGAVTDVSHAASSRLTLAAPAGALCAPRRSARSLLSMCWRRYGGTISFMAATRLSSDTRPVMAL